MELEAARRKYRYSSAHAYPWHEMGVGGQHHATANLPPGKKTLYPKYTRVGLGAGLDRHGKILPPSGFAPQTIQPITKYKRI